MNAQARTGNEGGSSIDDGGQRGGAFQLTTSWVAHQQAPLCHCWPRGLAAGHWVIS